MTRSLGTRLVTVRALWLLVSLSFRADPLAALLLCVAMPTSYLSPAAGAVATKFLVDNAVNGDTTAAIWAGVFAALAVLIAAGSLKVEVYLSYTIDKKVSALVQRRLARRWSCCRASSTTSVPTTSMRCSSFATTPASSAPGCSRC